MRFETNLFEVLTLGALLTIAAGEFTCAYEQHEANKIGMVAVAVPEKPSGETEILPVPPYRGEPPPDQPEGQMRHDAPRKL